jgi:hypothetical protein
VQIAKRNLTEAAKLLIDIVAETPEKEFAVEL